MGVKWVVLYDLLYIFQYYKYNCYTSRKSILKSTITHNEILYRWHSPSIQCWPTVAGSTSPGSSASLQGNNFHPWQWQTTVLWYVDDETLWHRFWGLGSVWHCGRIQFSQTSVTYSSSVTTATRPECITIYMNQHCLHLKRLRVRMDESFYYKHILYIRYYLNLWMNDFPVYHFSCKNLVQYCELCLQGSRAVWGNSILEETWWNSCIRFTGQTPQTNSKTAWQCVGSQWPIGPPCWLCCQVHIHRHQRKMAPSFSKTEFTNKNK